MPRKARRQDQPGRRRRAIADATPQPLAVIAGLPRRTHQAARIELERQFPRWRIISEPYPDTFEKIYTFEPPILATLRGVAAFAAENQEAEVPRPARLVLFYVDTRQRERLLDAVGYAALPVPLVRKDWHWPQGRHWRIDIDATIDALVSALRSTEEAPLSDLRLRLERVEKDEPLLLPPRNFRVGRQDNLVPRFDRLIREGGFQAERFDDIRSQDFEFDDLFRFFRRVPGKSARFRVDARGLVFAISPRGQHGPLRAGEIGGMSLQRLRFMLEGMYRFGTPLRRGFQHDVQWPGARDLQEESFFCSDRGAEMPISGDHVDIYPNDRVRGG